MSKKNPILVPKRTMVSPDYGYGVCLWRMPNGNYIEDIHQNKLNCPGKIGDKIIEGKMKRAALSCGVEDGEPFWMPGFRRITDMEWDDQMADLLDGGVPDAVDLWRQTKYGE